VDDAERYETVLPAPARVSERPQDDARDEKTRDEAKKERRGMCVRREGGRGQGKARKDEGGGGCNVSSKSSGSTAATAMAVAPAAPAAPAAARQLQQRRQQHQRR